MGDWMEAINYDKKANGKIQTNAKGEKQSAEMEEMRTEYHKYCPKSKSNNIIYCPKEIIKKKIKKDSAAASAEEDSVHNINKGMKLKKLNKHFERISDKKRKGKKKKETKRKTQKKDKKAKRGVEKRRENKKGGGKKGDKKRKGKKGKDKKGKGKKRKGKKRKGKKR